MTYSVEVFNPGIHAGPAPQYHQPNIVVGTVPLTEISFDDTIDGFADLVGPRDADSCPKRGDLVAVTEEPQIPGAALLQHLTVTCPSRATLMGENNTAYSVCSVKLGGLSLDIDNLGPEWVTDPELKPQISCPFLYLGGVVSGGAGTVRVALDAESPTYFLARHHVVTENPSS